MIELSRAAPPADDLEDAFGQVGRQSGGHLVEHQHGGLDRERTGEVDDPERRERQRARGGRQVEARDAELRQPCAEGLDGRARESQVRGDVEVGDERRLLVHRHDPAASGLARGAGDIRLATDEDRAAVRVDGAGQDLDEGALAGAVGAHERVDLTGPDRQRGGAQGRDGAIVLGDPGGLEQQVRHRVRPALVRWVAWAEVWHGDAGVNRHPRARSRWDRGNQLSPGPLQSLTADAS